jgi:hypothetical protein
LTRTVPQKNVACRPLVIAGKFPCIQSDSTP